MKAILLSAGLGTRLRPITSTIPKCLVSVNGKPMLQHWIEKLALLGVQEFLINTHYLRHKVEDFVSTYQCAAKINLVHEKELLGTAGTILNNATFVDQDCFIVHTDTFVAENLTGFLRFHHDTPQFLYSAVGFTVEDPAPFGTFLLDSENAVEGFLEKNPASRSRIASAACFLVRPRFLDWMKEVTPYARDFSADTLVKTSRLGRVYITSGAVFDIGCVESLEACERYIAGGNLHHGGGR